MVCFSMIPLKLNEVDFLTRMKFPLLTHFYNYLIMFLTCYFSYSPRLSAPRQSNSIPECPALGRRSPCIVKGRLEPDWLQTISYENMQQNSTNVLSVDPDKTDTHIYIYSLMDTRLEFLELFIFLFANTT